MTSAAPSQLASPATVVVAHRDALMRIGLRAALADAGDLEVVADIDRIGVLCELPRGRCPDIVVVDARFREDEPEFLDRLLNGCHRVGVVVISPLTEAECPVCSMGHPGTDGGGRIVQLSDAAIRRAEPWCLSALEHGARGAVHRDVSEERLVEVVRRVARGAIVLDGWAPRMLAAAHGTSAASVTARELDIVREVARGLANKQIGARLGISEQTVKNHLARVMAKVGVHSRTELVRLVLERHLA